MVAERVRVGEDAVLLLLLPARPTGGPLVPRPAERDGGGGDDLAPPDDDEEDGELLHGHEDEEQAGEDVHAQCRQPFRVWSLKLKKHIS